MLFHLIGYLDGVGLYKEAVRLGAASSIDWVLAESRRQKVRPPVVYSAASALNVSCSMVQETSDVESLQALC